MSELDALNLNLLVALDALLDEGSVNGAARRLGVSPSAASHSLARLRGLLGDELLVRTPTGMVPTPRAEALAPPLRRALLELRRVVFDPPGFDPATARRTFRIATTDLFAVVLAPVIARARAEAPGVDLELTGDGADPTRGLDEGAVDIAIGVTRAGLESLVRRVLYTERFVCLVRADHPGLDPESGGLDLDTFCRLPHALISPRGRGVGVVDEALARLGRQRRIALRTPSFLAAPFALEQSDLVLTAPHRLARALAASRPLRVVEPPLTLPGFELCLFFHERVRDDPGHRWLRGLVLACFEADAG